MLRSFSRTSIRLLTRPCFHLQPPCAIQSECSRLTLSSSSRSVRRCFCTQTKLTKQRKANSKADSKTRKPDLYAESVQLPKTSLPFFEKSNHYEQPILATESMANLYRRQQTERAGSERVFTLLDGPPYANGDLHIGHAINKLLKDIFARYRLKAGYQLHYRPGWDCHGLPIELKALKSNEESFQMDAVEIRQLADRFAKAALDKQMSTMKSWAVLGDFANPYVTCSRDYVIQEIEAFHQLYKAGLIFKKHQPIYWSPSSRTALAESELEYNENHLGHSAYLKFRINEQKLRDRLPSSAAQLLPDSLNAFAVIWTTTPWTLPANQAIAYSKAMDYCLARSSADAKSLFLVSLSSLKQLETELEMQFEILCQLSGEKLQQLTYEHPLKPNQELPFIYSPFVNEGKGSGLVHTAPNHGYDDYLVFKQNNLELEDCLVNEKGCYNAKIAQFLPESAVGLPVVDDGSRFVLEQLSSSLLKYKQYEHNYPYDWRTKQPVITMATCQFFMNIDPIKKDCEAAIDKTNFIPPQFAHKLKQNITERPQWCISRQRCWGVPIPVFYHVDDIQKLNPIINQSLITAITGQIAEQGPDCWWQLPADAFLTAEVLAKEKLPGKPADYVKGTDILDVWFDSGLAFNHILKDGQADLIIEGQDQLRGWFLSSLILSVALRQQAPYRNVLIHGFAVDKDFKKMSKSLGNVLDPIDVVSGKFNLGADVLRIWVAQYSNKHLNVATGEDQFAKANEILQKIRKTLRFCISNLNDVQLADFPDYADLSLTDKYMLYRLFQYNSAADAAYRDYDLKTMMQSSIDFMDFVSAFYILSVKNTLYNNEVSCQSRRSAQATLYQIIEVLAQQLSPIAPLFFEHFAKHHPIHAADTDARLPYAISTAEVNPKWNDSELAATFQQLMLLREQLSSQFNGESILIKKHANIYTEDDVIGSLLSKMPLSELSDLLQTSSVCLLQSPEQLSEILQADPSAVLVELEKCFTIVQATPFNKCKRCRKFACRIEDNSTVCPRCTALLSRNYPSLLSKAN